MDVVEFCFGRALSLLQQTWTRSYGYSCRAERKRLCEHWFCIVILLTGTLRCMEITGTKNWWQPRLYRYSLPRDFLGRLQDKVAWWFDWLFNEAWVAWSNHKVVWFCSRCAGAKKWFDCRRFDWLTTCYIIIIILCESIIIENISIFHFIIPYHIIWFLLKKI